MTDQTDRRERYATAMDAVTGGICPTDLIDAVMAVADAELQQERERLFVPLHQAEAENARLRKEHATWRKLGQRNLERAAEELATARATTQRLNYEKQRLEKELATYRRAVAQWEVSKRGTYIPHSSLRAIGLASGKDILGSVRHLKHFERVEQAEAVVERVRRLHDALDAETDLTSPDDVITRGAAVRKIAAALDGWTDPAALRRMAGEAQQDEPVVTVHAAPNLSPEAQEALDALAAVAKQQFDCDFDHPHPEHPCGRHVREAQQDPTQDGEADHRQADLRAAVMRALAQLRECNPLTARRLLEAAITAADAQPTAVARPGQPETEARCPEAVWTPTPHPPHTWTQSPAHPQRPCPGVPGQPETDEEYLCRCGHGRAYHDAKYADPQCRLCPEDGERSWRHEFTPADTAQQPKEA